MDAFIIEVEKLNTLSYNKTLSSTRSLINLLQDTSDDEANIFKGIDMLTSNINKELKTNHGKITKFNRALEKQELNLSDYYKHPVPEWKEKLILNAINLHLLRLGELRHIGEGEEHLINEHFSKVNFSEMKQLQDQIVNRHELESTIEWFYKNQKSLGLKLEQQKEQDCGGSFTVTHDLDSFNDLDFEFRLHKLNFLKLINANSSSSTEDQIVLESMKYSQNWFPKLIEKNPTYLSEISQLMSGFILKTNQLPGEDRIMEQNLDLDTNFKELSLLFAKKYCSNLGIEYESNLFQLILTGFVAIPNYIRFIEKFPSTTTLTLLSSFEIPFSVELPSFLSKYHPIFICPVSKEETTNTSNTANNTNDNPPICLPCHHIISRVSLLKISKNGLSSFKCPYCPNNCYLKDCKQVRFHFI